VTTGPVGPEAAAWARLRMSDADRERAIGALKIAFVQGRLTKDELDTRAGLALVSRTYAELTAATANIPARPAPRPRPMPDWPPPELPASSTARRPANHWGVKWALALATIALPAMIEKAKRRVASLLDFGEHQSRANGVDGAGRDEDDIVFPDRSPLNQVRDRAVFD